MKFNCLRFLGSGEEMYQDVRGLDALGQRVRNVQRQ